MSVYIPLREGSKMPSVLGWTSPGYPGVEHRFGDWHGLRADHLVIMDFDTPEAMYRWGERIGNRNTQTFAVRTPRGWHLYYRWTPGSPEGPMVAVLPDTDVRAGRGSYVVAPGAEGYTVMSKRPPIPFNPAWLPERDVAHGEAPEEWHRIGEGHRNHSLTILGGALRRQGASPEAVARGLAALNAVLVEPPLELDEVRQIAGSVSRYRPVPDPVIELVD